MINYVKGNIFESSADALVNPVNCVGVMGKGLAEKFKAEFPKNYMSYRDYCCQELLLPGFLFTFEEKGKFIINAATKDHWRGHSTYLWVSVCIDMIKFFCECENIQSVAIPALGCGLGGLRWNVVKTFFDEKFKDVNFNVEIYEP